MASNDALKIIQETKLDNQEEMVDYSDLLKIIESYSSDPLIVGEEINKIDCFSMEPLVNPKIEEVVKMKNYYLCRLKNQVIIIKSNEDKFEMVGSYFKCEFKIEKETSVHKIMKIDNDYVIIVICVNVRGNKKCTTMLYKFDGKNFDQIQILDIPTKKDKTFPNIFFHDYFKLQDDNLCVATNIGTCLLIKKNGNKYDMNTIQEFGNVIMKSEKSQLYTRDYIDEATRSELIEETPNIIKHLCSFHYYGGPIRVTTFKYDPKIVKLTLIESIEKENIDRHQRNSFSNIDLEQNYLYDHLYERFLDYSSIKETLRNDFFKTVCPRPGSWLSTKILTFRDYVFVFYSTCLHIFKKKFDSDDYDLIHFLYTRSDYTNSMLHFDNNRLLFFTCKNYQISILK